MQRYFIGIAGLFYLGLSVLMFAPLFAPGRYAALERPENFLPLLDLFQIAGAAVACLAILSVHPFITDGAETQGMHTPFAHPGIHAVLVLAIAAIPLLALSGGHPQSPWLAERVTQSCQHTLASAAAAAFMVVLGFYPLKWRARHRALEERDDRVIRARSRA